MMHPFKSTEALKELRKTAEELLKEKGKTGPEKGNDLMRLAHEIEVSHIELELQNQELSRAKAEAEALQQEYSDLYNTSPVPYVSLSEKGRIERMNLSAQRLIEGDKKTRNLLGYPFSVLVSGDDFQIYQSFMMKLAVNREAGPVEIRIKGGHGHVCVHLEGVVNVNAQNEKEFRLALMDVTERKQAEEHLARSHEKLELEVQKRTEELKKRTDQLSKLSLKLVLAEQDERDRIAGILHDHLQQFIVGAKIGQEMLIRDVDDSLKSDAGRVLELINHSLDTSRNLSAELSPDVLRSGNLTESMQWLSDLFLKNHHFRVEAQLEQELVLEEKDLVILLFQSVRELLLNAVKYSGENSAHLELNRTNGELQIAVSDRGVGFDPKAERERVHNKKFGLFSIEERVLRLGGRFEIRSEPNKGAAVLIAVPFETAKIDEAPPRKEAQNEKKETREEPSGIRILLADDHEVMREGLSKMLNAEPDFEVVAEASNGEEAVRLAEETEPDVILMDINMPKMNGIEATGVIHSKLPHIRIIALTMYDEGPVTDRILNAGASAYCSKAGASHQLVETIRQS